MPALRLLLACEPPIFQDILAAIAARLPDSVVVGPEDRDADIVITTSEVAPRVAPGLLEGSQPAVVIIDAGGRTLRARVPGEAERVVEAADLASLLELIASLKTSVAWLRWRCGSTANPRGTTGPP